MKVMSTLERSLDALRRRQTDAAGIVSWVHIGDLHASDAAAQNLVDFRAIINEINETFADSVTFVYLPGDVANDGSADEYSAVAAALSHLRSPWFSIIGDHDVHEKSFENYLASMTSAKYYSFVAGQVRVLALNAFDVPEPGSFCIMDEQLAWLEKQMRAAEDQTEAIAILMHCYPTDLKQGAERLRELIASAPVRLVEMGHTHYNEVSNDGHTLYAATRSTGQIEEGPVGFSVTNIDNGIVSWKFFELNALPAVMITQPVDERLITEATVASLSLLPKITVRAKIWTRSAVRAVTAILDGREALMAQVEGCNVWQVEINAAGMTEGTYELLVRADTIDDQSGCDQIRLVYGASAYKAPKRMLRDQDNAIGAWPERGLLGTQLGPNKNGRKW